MIPDELLPNISDLHFISLKLGDACLSLFLELNATSSSCPLCDKVSRAIHSTYCRELFDLPWAGFQVKVVLKARKFFCKELSCERKIFAERPEGLKPYVRRTARLTAQLHAIGMKAGGKPGADLANQLGMPTSATTMLRILHQLMEWEFETPRVLGVDDWAFKKSRSYGTILVDLEKRRPVDLLPDREAETLRQWLVDHPGVEIISRDRASAYSSGAQAGAPDAIQIADRWHLLKNVREMLQKMFEGNRRVLTEVCEQAESMEKEREAEVNEQESKATSAAENQTNAKQQPHSKSREEINYDQVKILHTQEMKVSKIAREVGISRNTVYKYINADVFPERSPKKSLLTPYLSFLRKRTKAGLKKVELWQEVVAQGYKGTYRGFCHTMYQYFPEGKSVLCPKTDYLKVYSPRRLSYILMKDEDKQSDTEKRFFQCLFETSSTIKKATELTLEFCGIVRKRKADEFDDWLTRAENSDVIPLVNFTAGIRNDYDAIKNACTLEWSNGQVEGQVNRLKNIKRQMYGRGSFELLKKMVVQDTG